MLDKTILVTGFGPFGAHDVNASWQAVRLLDELHFDGYRLVKHEVPVSYAYVDAHVARLWAEHNPTFVLHVGVSAEARAVTLETLARRKFYRRQDAQGAHHPTGEAVPRGDGPDVHFARLDVEAIVAQLDGDEMRFVESTDAGLYLCEYVFYASLHVDDARVLFAHVPMLREPYTAEELAHGLARVVDAALQRLPDGNAL